MRGRARGATVTALRVPLRATVLPSAAGRYAVRGARRGSVDAADYVRFGGDRRLVVRSGEPQRRGAGLCRTAHVAVGVGVAQWLVEFLPVVVHRFVPSPDFAVLGADWPIGHHGAEGRSRCPGSGLGPGRCRRSATYGCEIVCLAVLELGGSYGGQTRVASAPVRAVVGTPGLVGGSAGVVRAWPAASLVPTSFNLAMVGADLVESWSRPGAGPARSVTPPAGGPAPGMPGPPGRGRGRRVGAGARLVGTARPAGVRGGRSGL